MGEITVSRDEVRKALLAPKKEFKRSKIKVNGAKLEILAPSVLERSELRKACTNVDDEGVEFNVFEYGLKAVIAGTVLEGTITKAFDDEDYDNLCSYPAGSWVDELIDLALTVYNISGSTKEQVDDAKKN